MICNLTAISESTNLILVTCLIVQPYVSAQMKLTVLAEKCLSHLLNVTDNNILIELCESSQMFVEKMVQRT